MHSSFQFMEALLKHLITQPDPLVVRVYDYALLVERKYEYGISYDMMRCGILEDDEKLFVDYVGEAWDVYNKDAWTRIENGTCQKYPQELSLFCQEQPELAKFLKKVVTEGRYKDLHSGNVMRDEDANFVLIDLEGFIHLPLDLEDNNWITR